MGFRSVIIHREPGGQCQGCAARRERMMLHMIIHATG